MPTQPEKHAQMIFEILLTSCLASDPTDCGTGRIPVEGDLTACRERARVIAANVPASAQLQSYPCVMAGQTPDFAFSEIAPGVFVHQGQHAGDPDTENRGDLSNITFIIGDASVAVIDSGTHPWIGREVLKAIRAETALPVSNIILTHMHPDHVLGARPLLEDGGSVIGHAKLAEALSARASNYIANMQRLGLDDISEVDIVLPDAGVELVQTISLGNRELILSAHPLSHTNNDLTVLDMATGTLILGDLLFAGHTPALDGSATGWKQVIEDLVQLPAQRVVPGHGPVAQPWPEAAKPLLAYLNTLIDDTRAELDAGTSMLQAVERIAESERKRWLLFDAFNKRNATVTYQELEWE